MFNLAADSNRSNPRENRAGLHSFDASVIDGLFANTVHRRPSVPASVESSWKRLTRECVGWGSPVLLVKHEWEVAFANSAPSGGNGKQLIVHVYIGIALCSD